MIDDDIVKVNEALLFETTSFKCNFSTYTYDGELRCGYYKGNCGSISEFTSTNNWALDTFFIDLNKGKSTLVVHRGFNIKNYVSDSLRLDVKIKYKKGFISKTKNFSFIYSWGSGVGFHGWYSDSLEFINFMGNDYNDVKSVELNYTGALI